jgi:MFS family permease
VLRYIADLRVIWAGQGFRRLFWVRLISRFGDGLFQAGLGTYVFFNAQSFPNPGSAAAAFTVLYLPYSLVGPFAGVFIDRWSRRQILVWSAVARAAAITLTALLITSGSLGLPVYSAALLVFGINRFFLSALSAALPHVVSGEELVMANAIAPPLGSLAAFAGGGAGIVLHLLAGQGPTGSAITLIVAGVGYLTAGGISLLMARDSLGPDERESTASERVAAQLAAVIVGLAAGIGYTWRRRRALAALAVTFAQEFLFGLVLLIAILLYRNYFYAAAGANAALSHFLVLLTLTGIGAGVAALVTPAGSRRLTKANWITLLLASGGVSIAAFGLEFAQLGFLALGLVIGTASQGAGICTTTIFQEEIADEYLGRIFSLADMAFNVGLVLGAALAAAVVPLNGHSFALLASVGVGYVAVAVGYRLLSGPSPVPSPAAPAHASSS